MKDTFFTIEFPSDGELKILGSRFIGNAVPTTTKKHAEEYELIWDIPSEPYLTKRGKLTSILAGAIKNVTNTIPEISTTGGTSDGRFISKICSQVVEFGPINASIHKINEHINITDIEKLKNIYKLTLVKILEN